ncbi:hypothetical protein IKG13_00575 [Candidatus Saccharibacteria bacterium]|nr:hypothetical protein [Candidatus Saccharibacteria bacterium]MBR3378269.1 hypothetical protein [Candidatus Saccharibacteria bacterium]
MEPNWLQRFSNNDGEAKKINPVVAVFVVIQVILFVLVIITIARLKGDDVTENDVAYNKKAPELVVNGLKDAASFLKESDIADIQKKIFKVVAKSTNDINTDKIEATIRSDTVYLQSFDENTNYLKMTIDIPSIEQSYNVIYGSNAVLDPEVSTFVLCPDSKEEVVYKNFKCKNGDDESIRHKVVAKYLRLFSKRNNHFSAGAGDSSSDVITIAPSSFNNSEATKTSYINEVKASIDSLGMSSDDYKYYVLTAADVDYDHNENI